MADKLTSSQRKNLLTIVVGNRLLRREEINEITAKLPDPFRIEWHDLKWARQKADVRLNTELEESDREAFQTGIAVREYRMAERSELYAKCKQVIAERAADPTMQDVPGGKTGLMVRDIKNNGFTPVYKVDAPLLKIMLDYQREQAIDRGQWTEKKELSGSLTVEDAKKMTPQEAFEYAKKEGLI